MGSRIQNMAARQLPGKSPMPKVAEIFKCLLYKAGKKKQRHYISSVLLPSLLVLIFVVYEYVRSGVSDGAPTWTPHVPAAISQDDVDGFYPTGDDSKLYYAPNNSFTEEIIQNVRQKLYIMPDREISFATVSEMEQQIMNSKDFYAIAFDTNSSNHHLSYIFRTMNNEFRSDEVYSRDLWESFMKDGNVYLGSGFLALEYAMEKTFVELCTGLTEDELPVSNYQHIPLPKNVKPQESSQIYAVCSMIAVFVWLSCNYPLLFVLVEEKNSGLREHLKIITSLSYWNEVAICLLNFLEMAIVVILFMGITSVFKVWVGTVAHIVFICILIVLFMISSITFTLFISATLESVGISCIVFPLCYFVPVVLAYFTNWLWLEIVLILFPITGFEVGVSILYHYQNSGHNFHMMDAFRTGYPGNELISLFDTMLILTLGSVLWTFLWYYISNVRPGKYGTPKHWQFMFKKDHYRVQNTKNNCSDDNNTNSNKAVIENGDHLEQMIKISNLKKTFKTSSGTKNAVENLSLQIPKNQITVLLGHNGAGKTTTMNIIAGMTPQTSGRIEVKGIDDSNAYRQHIGYCPQHNITMNYMTCRENLIFFAWLRGGTFKEAQQEVAGVLEKVNLLDKQDKLPSHLSGGMKRRLCLANAIVGKTTVLVLDEPTAGLDFEGRRSIRELLLKLHEDHTILITTHFMDEAEKLADWIAIMENGKLVAFGTSVFLKNHYGKGYTLKMHKRKNFNQSKMMADICNRVSGVEIKSAVEPMFAVTLPYSSMEQYAALLDELTNHKEEYGIDCISVNNTTMEEVFLSSSSDNKPPEEDPQSQANLDDPNHPNSILTTPAEENSTNIPVESNTTPQDDSSQITFSNAEANSTNNAVESNTTPQDDLSQITFSNLKSQINAVLYKKKIHMRSNAYVHSITCALPIIATILCFLLTGGSRQTRFGTVSLHYSSVNGAFAVIALNGKDRPFDYDTLKNGSYFRNLDFVLVEDQNVEDCLLAEASKDVTRYYDQLVAAVDFNVADQSMKVLYNNNLLHSAGIAVNLASNLLLNYYGHGEAQVSVQNSPLMKKTQLNSITADWYTYVIAIASALHLQQYLQLPFLEASSGFRQLQNINQFVFWAATFVVGFGLHILICLAVFIAALIADREQVFNYTEHAQIFTVLILYGMAGLLVVYIISRCVYEIGTAVTVSGVLTIFGIGIAAVLSYEYDSIKKYDILILLLHVVPEFGLLHSLRVVYENQKIRNVEALKEANFVHQPSAQANQPLHLTYMYTMMPFMFVILAIILVDFVDNMYQEKLIVAGIKRAARLVTCRTEQKNSVGQSDSNQATQPLVNGDNVTASSSTETEEICQGPVHYIRKHYHCGNLSFNTAGGICFGLLGSNGAGKTSTVQTITHNKPITDGNIYLDGKHHENKDGRFHVGYCPQVDALLDFMTPYELIKYYAMMKNSENLESLIEMFLTNLDIVKFANIPISECSGGTKRKINTILAMVGNPSIACFDEPTTGVDAKSKRTVWNAIKALIRNKQVVVLTSHSMEECEELCNLVSIMLGGNVLCNDSIQRLKEKHGNGSNVVIELKNRNEHQREQLTAQIKESFECELKENHDGMLKINVKDSVPLSTLFSTMVSLKSTHPTLIASFSINETSLEGIIHNCQSRCSADDRNTQDGNLQQVISTNQAQ